MEEEKKTVNEKSKTARSYTQAAFLVLCILGISIFISYYFLFKENFLEDEKQSIISNKIVSPRETLQKKEPQVLQPSKKAEECKCTNIEFYRKYLLVKNMADSGEDYSSEVIELSKQDSLFKDFILELVSLAKENEPDYYFAIIFKQLANLLYNESSDDHIYNEFSKDFIKVRKIGKRALGSGGLDKYITIAQDALEHSDLILASETIAKISDSNHVLKEFKHKLSNRIRIKYLVEQIDQRMIIGEEK